MDVVNLEKLAGYLEVGDLQADFDMTTYCEPGYFYMEVCGRAGCASGHGPYAGIPKRKGETWEAYDARVFDLSGAQWLWCFGSHWALYDPTPLGAARRIRFLINHPDVVDNSDYSQLEILDLCNQELNSDSNLA